MMNADLAVTSNRRDLVKAACDALRARPSASWTAARLARAAGTSGLTLQRAFRDVLGLSPRDYIVAARRRNFLDIIRRGERVTDAVYTAGFGSPSRVYDAIRLPGMTPATYGRGGQGARIRWAVGPSPVGRIMVAATERGLCFVQIGEDATMARALAEEFPLAVIEPRPARALKPLLDAATAVAAQKSVPQDLPIDIRGTAFQWRVWRALTRIPRGETRSYTDIARAIGRPTAVRAVARACATNPVALVVPCHRVVSQSGAPGGYRWGAKIKKQLIAREK